MSDTVIIVDGPDEGPGVVRGDFKGGGLTDAGWEFASIYYTGIVLLANQFFGIQPNELDKLVERNPKNIPAEMLDCNWAAWAINADLAKHILVAIHILLKIQLARTIHVAGEHDQACAWVQVAECWMI